MASVLQNINNHKLHKDSKIQKLPQLVFFYNFLNFLFRFHSDTRYHSKSLIFNLHNPTNPPIHLLCRLKRKWGRDSLKFNILAFLYILLIFNFFFFFLMVLIDTFFVHVTHVLLLYNNVNNLFIILQCIHIIIFS